MTRGCVIGAGVIGCAVGLEMRLRGFDVIVINLRRFQISSRHLTVFLKSLFAVCFVRFDHGRRHLASEQLQLSLAA